MSDGGAFEQLERVRWTGEPLRAAGIPHPSPHLVRVTVDARSPSPPVPHLNNVQILHLVDRAAEDHLDLHGWTRSALLASRRMWFVRRHEIDYLAESFAGDRLVVATWVRSFSRTTSLRATRIMRERDGEVVVEALSRWVHVDLDTRRPTRIPAEVLVACPAEPCSDPSQAT